jgi:4-hydroxybenzoate polyprenyltransferase
MENQQEVSTPTARSVGVKWGLISALISVAFFLILVIAGTNALDNKWGWVSSVFVIVLMVLAHREFKQKGDGYMTYGQGVGIGFWMTLVSLLIGGLVTYVYANIIDPDTMQNFYEMQRIQMEEKNVPDEQIEIALEWTRKLFWVFYAIGGLVGGLIIALIVSIFTKKDNPAPPF